MKYENSETTPFMAMPDFNTTEPLPAEVFSSDLSLSFQHDKLIRLLLNSALVFSYMLNHILDWIRKEHQNLQNKFLLHLSSPPIRNGVFVIVTEWQRDRWWTIILSEDGFFSYGVSFSQHFISFLFPICHFK